VSAAVRITLGLGSNLGDRAGNLAFARERIRESGVERIRSSSLWQTDPVGPAQPDYLNQVLVGWTCVDPRELLDRFQRIEVEMGRDRGAPRNTARIIDIDILSVGDQVRREPELCLPHAACLERRFVLVPWAEVDGAASIPTTGGTVAEALAELERRSSAGAGPRVELWKEAR
jgi:2-amino-4-hydroxy-6-hydroxymethyldihydropteridine diphosphokinase